MTNPHTLYSLYNRIRALEAALANSPLLPYFQQCDFLAEDIAFIARQRSDIVLYTRHDLREAARIPFLSDLPGDPMVEVRVVVKDKTPSSELSELARELGAGLSGWPFQVISYVRTESEQRRMKSPEWEPLTARDEAQRSPDSATRPQTDPSSKGASE